MFIPFQELKNATANFRPDRLVGEGESGRVYKGWIHEHSLTGSKLGSGVAIAVKFWKFHCYNEWLAEVSFLSRLHHTNLINLLGYCSEDDKWLSIYEFIPKESLDNLLFGKGHQPLSWGTRVKVAIGAARGLQFLHQEKVINRSVGCSSILLDEEFNAKLSDFALAMYGMTDDRTHMTTRVMGTYRYVAPEYLATGQLTAKCDVYSFGVVLLELLSGRRAIDIKGVTEVRDLVQWAKPCLGNKRKWYRIMDKKLQGRYSKTSAYAAANTALQCLDYEPSLRPSMDKVVATHEKLQDHA